MSVRITVTKDYEGFAAPNVTRRSCSYVNHKAAVMVSLINIRAQKIRDLLLGRP